MTIKPVALVVPAMTMKHLSRLGSLQALGFCFGGGGFRLQRDAKFSPLADRQIAIGVVAPRLARRSLDLEVPDES